MKSEQDESGSKELGFFLGKITKRSDYVKASKGQYIKTCALFLQKVKRDDKKNPRYGVTASKKIGNAVERNKAKRRIRVVPQDNESEAIEYMVPKGKLLAVQEGDFIRKGDMIIDGSPVPHDILNILGIEALFHNQKKQRT